MVEQPPRLPDDPGRECASWMAAPLGHLRHVYRDGEMAGFTEERRVVSRDRRARGHARDASTARSV